jgi:hypothetical protein
MKYNGHKNWNHWNVALWINKDEGLCRMALGAARRTTLDAAATELMQVLEGQKTPDGAPYTFSSVRAALCGIR